MAKFSGPAAPPANVHSPITTSGLWVPTYEGGVGVGRDARSELFVLAVANMVGEATFYEAAAERDRRFVNLVHAVTAEDPEWVARFVPYLRSSMNMRSASVVAACEYVKAGGPNGRRVIDGACARADEPAEILGYWLSTHGRKIPQPVKRGAADAAVRLYNETSALRYDGQSRTLRMADVIDLTHPKPKAPWQSDLFAWLLDRRHNRPDISVPDSLNVLRSDSYLMDIPAENRRAYLRTAEGRETFARAGWSWERLSGWLPGGMDAEAWTFVIPHMGYMALLRNLRNFDQAGVPDEVAAAISSRLADPEQVARSRQFPFRFLSAWKATQSMRWGMAIEKALDLSVANIAPLAGRTLILVDASGSMQDAMSGRSEAQRWEVAAVFAAALARRCEQADVYAYSNSLYGPIPVSPSASVLRTIPTFVQWQGAFGGTATMGAIATAFAGQDRVVVLTDEQARDAGPDLAYIPRIYTWNLAGYRAAHLPSGQRGRHTFAGLSDQAFAAIPLLEAGDDQCWPF